MYTYEDYIRDLYIREHGHGWEQAQAEMRCIDYEHGRDPETAPAERRARAEKCHRTFRPFFWISILISLLFVSTAQIGFLFISIVVNIVLGILAFD